MPAMYLVIMSLDGISREYLHPLNQRELRALETAFGNFSMLFLAKLEVIMRPSLLIARRFQPL
jgi:hypothetical protein